MIDWVLSNLGKVGVVFTVLTFLLSFVVLAFSALRFVTVRRDAQRQVEFKNYHDLIAQFVGSQRPTTTMKIDSQIAIAFELRRFKRYKPVTRRILSGLRDEWLGSGTNNVRLINEIDLTIKKLSPVSGKILKRFL